jgi:sugar phosphate isomerase/epimerase
VTPNLLALSPTTLPDTPPLEYVEAAAAAGYDAVGLRLNRSPLFPFHPVAGNASLVRELKRALARSRLGVLDILSFYLQPVTNIEAFAAPLELGAELGARYALVAGDDADGSRLRDNLGRFCDLARPFGVTAAVEFAVIRPLATLGQTLRLLADAGRENAVVCLDPLNHIRGGGTVAELHAVDPRLFPYAQISDGVLGQAQSARARTHEPPPASPARRRDAPAARDPRRLATRAAAEHRAADAEGRATVGARVGPHDGGEHAPVPRRSRPPVSVRAAARHLPRPRTRSARKSDSAAPSTTGPGSADR